jgi:hypothetical protein
LAFQPLQVEDVLTSSLVPVASKKNSITLKIPKQMSLLLAGLVKKIAQFPKPKSLRSKASAAGLSS